MHFYKKVLVVCDAYVVNIDISFFIVLYAHPKFELFIIFKDKKIQLVQFLT